MFNRHPSVINAGSSQADSYPAFPPAVTRGEWARKGMNLRNLFVVAATLLSSNVVFAGDAKYTAELAQPVVAQKTVVANGNIWECVSSTCRIVSAPQDASLMRTCKDLRRQVGALSSYGSSEKPFDTVQLTKCNAK